MPRPEKHVFVCTQSRPEGHPRGSCAAKNCGAVAETFFAEFQQRFLWGRFSVASSSCVGPCSQGPNVLVYPDGVLYNGVRPEDVAAIIEEHLIGGRPVERLRAPAEVW
jgi:(2Fe-2S) ferredoxin